MQKLTQQDRETRVSGETGLYRLRIYEKGVLLRTHVVRSPSVTIGRVAECDIQVENGWLSRKHAQLDLLEPGVVRVRDLRSRNGTFAEGQRIEQREFRSNFAFNVGGEVKVEVEFLSEVAGLIPEGEMVPGAFGGAPREDSGMAGKIVCPHCWHVFQVEKILAIAQHTDLLGDPVLGDNAPQRFLPSRFTPDGRALDAYGVPCPDFACPQCHLVIPRTLTQKPPLFFSIIGAPASGKSYLLTAMTWELRRLMPREFGFAFGDADASSNAIVNEYERTLFMNADDEGWTTLEKTEMQGRMYDRVRLHNMDVWLPRPLLFSLSPQPNHPQYTRSASQLTQTLVVYDNAGEAFQPDRDTAANPGTRHLARSNGMFFLFDPTKDPRFRAECQSGDPQTGDGAQVEQQEILLSEAISRVKRHSDSSLSQRLDRPLIVVVTKYDVWRSLLGYSLPNPWRKLSSLATAALDLDAVGAVSFAVRQLLMRFCPQIVATAESFSSQVSYLPGSAIGHSPTAFRRLVKLPGKDKKEQKTFLLVRPRDIQPIWAPVPVVQMLAHFGLVPVLTHKRTEEHPKVKSLRLSGNSVIFNIPGTNRRLEAPSAYLGRLLRCVETGKLFWLPSAEEIDAAARRLRGQ